jgi:6-phosphofructokinase 1
MGGEAIRKIAEEVTRNLQTNRIDILYVIGGDGSLKTAYEIALQNPTRSVIAIPKTMDNDVLWVWQSFGFDTAVEQAVRVVNTLRSEAEATRRICVIELFGADSGFVAANASLASGHVDAVLIPEIFKALSVREAAKYLERIIDHIGKTVKDEDQRAHNPHAVVVVAESVGTALEKKGAIIEGVKVEKSTFVNQFKQTIEKTVVDAHRKPVPVFVNQPRHHIRAVPANAHDQIYCERLGALAVDNALGGYTGSMISQWLTEFVLVPISLVTLGKKSIPIKGMFWKQVVSNTGQPMSPAEHVSSVRTTTAQRVPPG